MEKMGDPYCHRGWSGSQVIDYTIISHQDVGSWSWFSSLVGLFLFVVEPFIPLLKYCLSV